MTGEMGSPELSRKRKPASKRLVVGVLGGMGPAATHAFFGHLTANTRASRDQDHLHVIIDSDSSIPDRTAYLTGDGLSPVPSLVAAAKRLQAAGAQILVMPCNTAGAFADAISAAIVVPLVDWVSVTSDAVAAATKQRAGVLATTGTIQAGLYQRALQQRGRQAIAPDGALQADLMEAVYGRRGIKAGVVDARVRALILGTAHQLMESGAEALLLACSELAIALPDDNASWPGLAIDPAVVVARRVIQMAGGHLRDNGAP